MTSGAVLWGRGDVGRSRNEQMGEFASALPLFIFVLRGVTHVTILSAAFHIFVTTTHARVLPIHPCIAAGPGGGRPYIRGAGGACSLPTSAKCRWALWQRISHGEAVQ